MLTDDTKAGKKELRGSILLLQVLKKLRQFASNGRSGYSIVKGPLYFFAETSSAGNLFF